VCQDFGTPGFCFVFAHKKMPLSSDKGILAKLYFCYEQHDPEAHDPELQPPPPTGFVEVIENPEPCSASTKSIFTAPHVESSSFSIKN
jgi:hypothetical protein